MYLGMYFKVDKEYPPSNLTNKFNLFPKPWSNIVGELNASCVKLTKLNGEFVIIPKGIEHLLVAEKKPVFYSLSR